jgi:SH3-like domain-containing protein
MKVTISRGLAVLALLALPQLPWAQDRGPVTNLPLPRYVSLKVSEANARRGPSLTHRIDWVFKRRGMPLRITAEYGHWRRVQDRDGAGGWVHYTLLSGARTALVRAKMLDMRARPRPDAMVIARLEQDVIARLDTCDATWCAVSAEGYRGWTVKSALWGIEPDETLE